MWIKICGLTCEEDLEAAIEAGADAVGFVLQPESKRYVTLERAKELAARSTVPTVAVMGPWHEGAETWPFTWLQSIGPWTVSAPHMAVLHDLSAASLDGPISRWLIDAHVPGAYGGTGQTADWNLSAALVRENPTKEIVLAGGLNPENVESAIRQVQPFGIDACSGTEREPGRKDVVRLREFIQRARAAE